ncbi:CaiB/BaiF CoA-transferase family protein [Hydrogenophaga sp.]|uniref:CaiB/BaiF CoA transferase family protein n=1 Tax=Hydrogenophaga sp. TaxID=1904254 RepID=UPI00271A55C3|nr:CoA transferase [Hydrogenophaga sp.]MDO9433953.1 CoA transferase [Hydrogenophaga sp.]
MPSNPSSTLPLKGIKVVELCHLIAGPYCCQMLADEGAHVIKVEPPDGELTRHREPTRRLEDGEITAYYASLNRDKESVSLDLKNAEGAKILEKLIGDADIFVTNMRVGALERLGFHPDALRKRYPRLIVAVISGFGMHNAGGFADRAGLAMVAEAKAGATGLTRDHSGNAVWCGFALGDIMAAVSAHAGILLALRNQEKLGEGRLIDTALVECMLPMIGVALSRVQVEDKELQTSTGSNNFHGVPYGAYPASDGFVNIGCNRDEFWRRLAVAMGQPELGTDERYATYRARVKNQKEVQTITQTWTRAHTRAEIEALLVKADVPVAGVLSMEEVASDTYLRGRGALCDVDDGFGGNFVLPTNAAWREDVPHKPRVPRLGEHRNKVLTKDLGMTTEEVARLEAAGAFGAPKAVPKVPAALAAAD